ncbi:MAG: PHP domain-containing protein [Burkholderiales bacterium]|nr:PHP domain-containing protein [Burkholderiales bacterium]
MRPIDFHCHSTVSDGMLPPAALAARAANNGCRWLALTDHDDLDGLAIAAQTAADVGMGFVPGVEISVSWRDVTLHVVGLAIDPACPTLREGLTQVRSGRAERAEQMADGLARAGIGGALQGAYRYASNPALISRAHFARYLVEQGHARDTGAVFKRFLVRGKPGYVRHEWATLGAAVEWIHAAGGLAIIAHPGRYRVNGAGMQDLLREFRDLGGDGIEVITSSHSTEDYRRFNVLAHEAGLLASVGSDFHAPEESWMDVGGVPDLPLAATPVWEALGLHWQPEPDRAGSDAEAVAGSA